MSLLLILSHFSAIKMDSLPEAATCSSTLFLPEYSRYVTWGFTSRHCREWREGAGVGRGDDDSSTCCLYAVLHIYSKRGRHQTMTSLVAAMVLWAYCNLAGFANCLRYVRVRYPYAGFAACCQNLQLRRGKILKLFFFLVGLKNYFQWRREIICSEKVAN